MRSLLIPVRGNHNNTVLLLALSQTLAGERFLVTFPTDVVADKLIQATALDLGVKLVRPDELLAMQPFDRIVLHGWSRDLAFLSTIPGFSKASIFLYGDGLSNRLMIGDTAATGFVLWGSEFIHIPQFQLLYPEMNILAVSNESIRGIWQMLTSQVGLQFEELGLTRGCSLVAMRYWASSTYLGIGLQDVRNAISGAYEIEPEPSTIWVKEDSRWQAPVDQVSLVRETLGHGDVRAFNLPLKFRRKMGHLANFDTVAYCSTLPEMSFFGFDGSLPLTIFYTQKNVKVLQTPFRLRSSFPPAQMLDENLDWQSAVISNSKNAQLDLIPKLVDSHSLRSSLFGVRAGKGYTNTHLGYITRTLLRDWGDDTESLVTQLANSIQGSARRTRVRRRVTKLIRESSWLDRTYFFLARFLLLRKLMMTLSRKLR